MEIILGIVVFVMIALVLMIIIALTAPNIKIKNK